MYCSPPGSSVHGILQARILKWVAISFSRGSSQPRNLTEVSCTAVRERALDGERGRRWESPEVQRAGRGAWLPGTGSRAVDDRRPARQTSAGPTAPGAMHRHAVQRARRTRDSALCGREPGIVVAGARSEGALGTGGRNLGPWKPSDPLSSDVAGRCGGRETPETTPRGAGWGGPPW